MTNPTQVSSEPVENVPEEDRVRSPETIGEGIRRERLRRGLTLAQLATRVSLTVSALSQIERGASDPSISSLRRIGQAFDVPMFQFLIGTEQREIVVRRDRRTKITFVDRALEYELVSADTSGEFEVL
jgi:transcriptional regulator with XRE-family HTH domain